MPPKPQSSTRDDEPTEEDKEAAWLVVKGKGATLSPPKPRGRKPKKSEAPKCIRPKIPDSEMLRLQRAENEETTVILKPRTPNYGPNPSGERGFGGPSFACRVRNLQKGGMLHLERTSLTRIRAGFAPQHFGLLDLQDIALFLWPPYRQRDEFTMTEQRLILRHRNPKLRSITREELVEVQEWMDDSEYITVEGKTVDIRDWRMWLGEKELGEKMERMEEDLSMAMSVARYRWSGSAELRLMELRRKRKVAAIEGH